MSFFSKQAFAEDEDSDIECEFQNDVNIASGNNFAPLNNNHDNNVAITQQQQAQPLILHPDKNVNTNSNTIDDTLFDSDSDSEDNVLIQPKSQHVQSNNNLITNNNTATILAPHTHTNTTEIKPMNTPLPQPANDTTAEVQALEFVLPSNSHLRPKKKKKKNMKKRAAKKKFKPNYKPFNHENVIRNDWKHKAGIVSTKVNNKQCPQAHPRSELNIQQRNQYVTLSKKEALNDEEQNQYNELSEKVRLEQNTFKAWLENFYKGRDQRHNDYKELSYFANKKNVKELLELVNQHRFNCLSYYFIHPQTMKQIQQMISIKKELIKTNYAPKYKVDIAGTKMSEIEDSERNNQNNQCRFEFLAHLKEGKTKIPRWKIEDKYLSRKYNQDTSMLDSLPMSINIYTSDKDEDETKHKNKNKCKATVTPHIMYKPQVSVSCDEDIDEILSNNPNSKDINVVIDESVMSLLIDMNADLRWKESFMIPFKVRRNPNKHSKDSYVLFMDKQCLSHEWRARYANHSYFKRVFRSYLAQNIMKENMNEHEKYLVEHRNKKDANDILKEILSKQDEWNECMAHYSNNPHFVYSMWRLNELHCLIRTQIYGQLATSMDMSNCYATLKLDYLNPHKQAFIAHHKMKDEMLKDDARNTLRNAESALYGVERLTDSERLRWFMQTLMRPNNKLLVGRMQIPSRKLISCSIVDHNTLLNDHLEHVSLEKRYNNSLYLIERLFKYLLNHCVSTLEDKQCLLAYNAQSDAINIFSEYEGSDNEETQLFDFHGYVDSMCGQLNDTNIDYVAPYSTVYRGVMMQCHIPDLSPPANAQLPRPCQMFLFHGFCPKYHANNEKEADKCELPHYRTHVVSHCWEYALYGGHCERGINCEWPHLRQQQLINKGYEMFHVRQLINYCQDYYKNGRCKNRQSRGTCNAVHFNEQQLMHEFHTKYKNRQMRKGQLLGKAKFLEKNLQLAQYQKFPGQRKRKRKRKNKRRNDIKPKT